MKKLRIILQPMLLILSMTVLHSSQAQQKPWVAPPEADELVNPVKDSRAALRKGRELYTAECVVCHGANGDAVTGIAKNLEQKPKNFTAEDFLKQSDGAIFWKLSEGRGLMQPFKTMMTEEEIWSVVEYVKFLANDAE